MANSDDTKSAKVDKEALKIFADAPKMAVTVVSFVTSAGAIVFRLSTASAADCDQTVQGSCSGLISYENFLNVLFVVGLALSFYSIILSYRMVSSITACFLEIADSHVSETSQQNTWEDIQKNEYPWAELAMTAAVGVWLVVILLSALTL